MVLVIRRAEPHDATTITRHNIAMALETENRKLDRATAKRGVLAVLDDSTKGFYLLAEYDRNIVGQCMVTFEWSDWRSGNFWWIQSVYVHPDCRRQGIFSRLFEVLTKEAENEPLVVGIRLYVEEENLVAQEAYRCKGLVKARYSLFEREFSRNLHE